MPECVSPTYVRANWHTVDFRAYDLETFQGLQQAEDLLIDMQINAELYMLPYTCALLIRQHSRLTSAARSPVA